MVDGQDLKDAVGDAVGDAVTSVENEVKREGEAVWDTNIDHNLFVQIALLLQLQNIAKSVMTPPADGGPSLASWMEGSDFAGGIWNEFEATAPIYKEMKKPRGSGADSSFFSHWGKGNTVQDSKDAVQDSSDAVQDSSDDSGENAFKVKFEAVINRWKMGSKKSAH